jgi:hypothetical protein
MQSHYEITVSRNGKFMFSTSERSATDSEKAALLTILFEGLFPVDDGYKVSVTYWCVVGKDVGSQSGGSHEPLQQ